MESSSLMGIWVDHQVRVLHVSCCFFRKVQLTFSRTSAPTASSSAAILRFYSGIRQRRDDQRKRTIDVLIVYTCVCRRDQWRGDAIHARYNVEPFRSSIQKDTTPTLQSASTGRTLHPSRPARQMYHLPPPYLHRDIRSYHIVSWLRQSV